MAKSSQKKKARSGQSLKGDRKAAKGGGGEWTRQQKKVAKRSQEWVEPAKKKISKKQLKAAKIFLTENDRKQPKVECAGNPGGTSIMLLSRGL